MKKIFLLGSALFLLSACQWNQKKTEPTKTTTNASSTGSSSKTTSSSEPTAHTTVGQTSGASAELQKKYPNEKFPAVSTIGDPNKLGIMVEEAGGTLTVSYFSVDKPVSLNDASLNGKQPIAQFQRITFSSTNEATQEVAPVEDKNGVEVDLGNGIIGHQQSAAGSSYLNWQEGNWHLGVQANNLEQEVPYGLAKKVVNYLEKAYLPAPQQVGQITLNVSASDYQSNRAVWQKNNVVYKTLNIDAMRSLEMAVSMNQ